jgi:hypothetical protein
MEEILIKDWADPETPSGPLGNETGEWRNGTTNATIFDDIDDYNNYTESPPKTIEGYVMDGTIPVGSGYTQALPDYRSYRRSAAVEYVIFNTTNNTFMPSVSSTDYKKVTVTVAYSPAQNFTSPNYNLSLSQVIAGHD